MQRISLLPDKEKVRKAIDQHRQHKSATDYSIILEIDALGCEIKEKR
jgi:hypothetical protein